MSQNKHAEHKFFARRVVAETAWLTTYSESKPGPGGVARAHRRPPEPVSFGEVESTAAVYERAPLGHRRRSPCSLPSLKGAHPHDCFTRSTFTRSTYTRSTSTRAVRTTAQPLPNRLRRSANPRSRPQRSHRLAHRRRGRRIQRRPDHRRDSPLFAVEGPVDPRPGWPGLPCRRGPSGAARPQRGASSNPAAVQHGQRRGAAPAYPGRPRSRPAHRRLGHCGPRAHRRRHDGPPSVGFGAGATARTPA